jgi:hypothetical protein
MKGVYVKRLATFNSIKHLVVSKRADCDSRGGTAVSLSLKSV